MLPPPWALERQHGGQSLQEMLAPQTHAELEPLWAGKGPVAPPSSEQLPRLVRQVDLWPPSKTQVLG